MNLLFYLENRTVRVLAAAWPPLVCSSHCKTWLLSNWVPSKVITLKLLEYMKGIPMKKKIAFLNHMTEVLQMRPAMKTTAPVTHEATMRHNHVLQPGEPTGWYPRLCPFNCWCTYCSNDRKYRDIYSTASTRLYRRWAMRGHAPSTGACLHVWVVKKNWTRTLTSSTSSFGKQQELCSLRWPHNIRSFKKPCFFPQSF